jgi:hypothetical protein
MSKILKKIDRKIDERLVSSIKWYLNLKT